MTPGPDTGVKLTCGRGLVARRWRSPWPKGKGAFADGYFSFSSSALASAIASGSMSSA